jgi:hypothetical protein
MRLIVPISGIDDIVASVGPDLITSIVIRVNRVVVVVSVPLSAVQVISLRT